MKKAEEDYDDFVVKIRDMRTKHPRSIMMHGMTIFGCKVPTVQVESGRVLQLLFLLTLKYPRKEKAF
jgi:hypothetical protein